MTFSGVYVCVSNAMVLLRFLLNTATSSRFPTGNKLFLKNISAVRVQLFPHKIYEQEQVVVVRSYVVTVIIVCAERR